MKFSLRKIAACFLLLVPALFYVNAQEKPYVVMLSLDGFRWDYTNRVPTPNFDFIAAHGVKAASLKPSFPTKTFPNHYTIVTGLYPDHHGIVANSFYDEASGREYKIPDRSAVEDGYFYGGEPIWVTAEKQGVRSASCFWVGSEADIQGKHPSYWKKYTADFTLGQSIDTVVHWLRLPEEERPHLVLFYNSEPDGTGHKMGPNSKNITEKVVEQDSLLGVFISKVSELPIADQINFIVVSDHGMTGQSPQKTVYLSDFIKPEWFEHIEGGSPVYSFMPKPAYKAEAYRALQEMEHVKVWKRGELPTEWHYGTNPRVLDFVLVADNGWQVKPDRESKLIKGNHGYDNNFKDMHAIFYAMGPVFKENYLEPTFENIQIYNLLCHILGLTPAPNDGRLETIQNMLKE